MFQQFKSVIGTFGGQGLGLLLGVGLLGLCAVLAVRIVPQSQRYIVERFGRFRTVLMPGFHLIIPFLDRVAYRVSNMERQISQVVQDVVTADAVHLQVETLLFFRVLDPKHMVYQIRNPDGTIATTMAGVVRNEVGKMALDEIQSQRLLLVEQIKKALEPVVSDWGVQVTRVAILDVTLDAATREAMLRQINAERGRRALVTEAEGQRRAVELAADADLYAAEQNAKARRIEADAEAYATRVVAEAISETGLEAAQYQVALKQVEALGKLGQGEGNQTMVVPAQALDSFSDAFKMLKKPD